MPASGLASPEIHPGVVLRPSPALARDAPPLTSPPLTCSAAEGDEGEFEVQVVSSRDSRRTTSCSHANWFENT